MQVTKYAHACFAVGKNGDRLIVDPGEMTPEYGGGQNVVGLIVTHEHFDHFDAAKIKSILAANPQAKVFTTEEVAAKLPGAQAVKAGEQVQCGPFNLDFFGESHQPVHSSFPTCQNIGVLIENRLYYAGDSFVLPGKPVELLLVPTSGPWQKMGETMDFISTIKPKLVTPTHNGLNSDAGNTVAANWLKQLADKQQFEFKPLGIGESLELTD